MAGVCALASARSEIRSARLPSLLALAPIMLRCTDYAALRTLCYAALRTLRSRAAPTHTAPAAINV